MRREGVIITVCTVVLIAFGSASAPVRADCQSTASRADEAQSKDGQANSPSSDSEAPAKQKQDADDKTPEKSSHGKTHVRLGTVTVAASYTHFPDGFFPYPFWGYGFYPYAFGYEPLFYEPLYYSSFSGPFVPDFTYRPDKGEVRLEAKPSSASVYLDDAYAGTAGKLKHIWLDPGAYDLTVANADGSMFHQRIYVLSGKSLKIKAKFVAPSD
jgi:hypothetical protein